MQLSDLTPTSPTNSSMHCELSIGYILEHQEYSIKLGELLKNAHPYWVKKLCETKSNSWDPQYREYSDGRWYFWNLATITSWLKAVKMCSYDSRASVQRKIWCANRNAKYIDCCLVTKSCPAAFWPMNYIPPGPSVHGISQARILEWVAISFSRGSSQPRYQTLISCLA